MLSFSSFRYFRFLEYVFRNREWNLLSVSVLPDMVEIRIRMSTHLWHNLCQIIAVQEVCVTAP